MIRYFMLVAVFLCAVSVDVKAADTVKIGESTIELVAPEGFINVLPYSEAAVALLKSFTPDNEVVLGAYFPEEQATKIIAGEIDESWDNSRLLTVTINKQFYSRSATAEDYRRIREMIRKEYFMGTEKMVGEVNEMLVGNIDELKSEFSLNDEDMKMQIDVKGIVPLSDLYETERFQQWGYIAKVGVSGAVEGKAFSESNDAMVIELGRLLVGGKILNMTTNNSYASNRDIVWAQKQSTAWASRIIEANANLPIFQTEQSREEISPFDNDVVSFFVLLFLVVGVVVAGLIKKK